VAPPRKRALASVPALEPETPKRVSRKAVRQLPPDEQPVPLGKNKRHQEEQKLHNSGPDLPPGLALSWLPKPEEVPPKPKTEPKMDWPGTGHARAGGPEWQLYTEFDKSTDELGVPLYREWRERWVPPTERRCIARATGRTNNWQGNRCTIARIKGGKVCRFHGGALPVVKKAAQAALAMAALPAAEKLIQIALTKKGVTDADRIKAIIQILDRAGVEGKQTIEIELPLWQKTLQAIYAGSLAPEGSEVPGLELEEGVDYVVEDEEEAEDDGED
jgi:hypothetical protein